MKEKQSAFELAKVLDILGGILVLVAGALEISSLALDRTIPSLDLVLTNFSLGIVLVLLGLVAVAGSRHVKIIVWDVAMVAVGIFAFYLGGRFPWEWGSLLILLGGVVGIVAKLA